MQNFKRMLVMTGYLFFSLLFFTFPAPDFASDTSRFLKPGDLKPGDVITAENWERLKGYVIPPVYNELRKKGKTIKVENVPITNRLKEQMEATKKYSPQVKLDDNGDLVNYVAGFPFDPDKLDIKDPQAGLKIGWNMSRKWFGDDSMYTILSPNPVGSQFISSIYKKGGGYKCCRRWCVDKRGHETVSDLLSWLIFPSARLRMEPKPVIPGYEHIEYMRMYRTLSPRDVAGTASFEKRYWKSETGDDFYLFIPSIRRVRRLPTNARASTRAPADYSWDDGGGWAGKTQHFDWKLLGERKALFWFPKTAPLSYKKGQAYSWDDSNWYLADVWVVEHTPKDPNYGIPKRIYYVDKHSYFQPHIWVYDRKGELWKCLALLNQFMTDKNGNLVRIGGGFNVHDLHTGHYTVCDALQLTWDSGLDINSFSTQNILRVSRGESLFR